MENKYIYSGEIEPNSLKMYDYDIKGTDRTIIFGYLLAAERIINTINWRAAEDDTLIFPLINLYSHSIEFCLKLLLRKLREHAECGACSLITLINSEDEKKLLKNHNISKLSDYINKIIPKNGKLHSFPEFNKISQCFITIYERCNINSYTSRYSNSDERIKYPFHSKENIRIFTLHHDVSSHCKTIQRYIDQEFEDCESSLYTKDRLAEIESALKVMRSSKHIWPSEKNSLEFFEFKKDELADRLYNESDEDIKLKEYLQSLDLDSLKYLRVGVSYSLGAASALSFADLSSYNKEKLIHGILTHSLSFELAYKKLKTYQKNVKKYLKIEK